MYLVVLDSKATHINNPDCPSRLIQKPDGCWMCADCGFEIIWTRIEVVEKGTEAKE